jgi:hypothetical protein
MGIGVVLSLQALFVFYKVFLLIAFLRADIGAWKHIQEDRIQPYYDMQVNSSRTFLIFRYGMESPLHESNSAQHLRNHQSPLLKTANTLI